MPFPDAPGAHLPRWLVVTPLLVLAAMTPVSALGAGQRGGGEQPATPAIEVPLGSSVLTTAVQSLGSFEGECFPWVRRVVERATGRQMGFSYRRGYLDAGAVEVSLESARGGDVIQLVNDADDGPDADYPGMHTSIILNAEGAGVFRVIDSNLGFDGIVRVREAYNPLALAARFPNINVHVYRFYDAPGLTNASDIGTRGTFSIAASGGQGVPPVPTPAPAAGLSAASAPAAPALPAPAQASASAVIRADGDCLRLRSAPTMEAPVLTCLPDGGTVTLLQGSVQADGVVWQSVAASGSVGWVASQYLVRTSAPAATPTPAASGVTPTPAAPTPTPAPAAPPASVPVASSGDASPAIIGDLPAGGGLALVVYSGGPVNSLMSVISQRGCAAVSVWASRTGGGLVGMIPGAPALVNREWRGEFPADSLAVRTPLIVVCGGGAPAATVSAAPAGPAAAAGPAPVVSRGSSTPPGPAGNE